MQQQTPADIGTDARIVGLQNPSMGRTGLPEEPIHTTEIPTSPVNDSAKERIQAGIRARAGAAKAHLGRVFGIHDTPGTALPIAPGILIPNPALADSLE